MTRVFLSYSYQDSAAAEHVARDWRERGAVVFRSGDPENSGKIILREIVREIDTADVFVALMSPAYMESAWCQREVELAVSREHRMDGQFMRVVEVVSTPHDEGGALRTYSWIDATGELTASLLEDVARGLRLPRRPTGSDVEFPDFHNREEELSKLSGALRTTGGRELWLVVSPPLMGKTWLLAKLEKELVNGTPPWAVHRMDLRRAPEDLRYEPARLVTTLLQTDDLAQDELRDEDLQNIALTVSARRAPLLFVLDGAELLDRSCAVEARAALTAIHRIVRDTDRHERFGLIIATRRPDEWRGVGMIARKGQRFESLYLTQFDDEVVYQALPADINTDRRWAHAQGLQRLSEGLPALLARCVQWAARNEFLEVADPGDAEAFDEVARDYIRKDLLSADILLTMGTTNRRQALAALRGTLRAISIYRLYTQSHLTFHLDANETLREALNTAGLSAEDLWRALGRTALQSNRNPQEIWHEIEPPLRRLLHRYYLRTPAERAAAHATARRFYGRWNQNQAAGREQQVVLVECLWHETSRLRIEQPDAVAERLPGIAVELARACGHGPMFHAAEFREAVVRRLGEDEELQMLLSEHDGLFDAIVEAVADAIGGDR